MRPMCAGDAYCWLDKYRWFRYMLPRARARTRARLEQLARRTTTASGHQSRIPGAPFVAVTLSHDMRQYGSWKTDNENADNFLRRSHANWLRKRGQPIDKICAWLGCGVSPGNSARPVSMEAE